jgi:hypothetical protein
MWTMPLPRVETSNWYRPGANATVSETTLWVEPYHSFAM